MAPSAAAGYADAVLVAAGASRRMGQDKLLAPLLGRPLLAWALEGLAAASSVRRLIIVVAPERVAEMAARPWLQATGARVVAGGPRRQVSVAAGLTEADAEVVLVHDGARPLVTPALADRVAAAARDHGAAVPLLPVAETLKRVRDGSIAGTVDRAGLATAQTPQGARLDLLRAAMSATGAAAADAPEYTDEAAILEAHGFAVAAVEGEPDNLKVTTLGDLRLAETLLVARRGAPRTSLGQDSHPFGPGDGLALGGIVLPAAPRLYGHSDGDAALHAIADGLLGAAALGDLGRRFPADDPATAGIASSALVRAVVADLTAAGWRPSAVDLQLEGARPHLGGARLDAMRDAIAGLLDLDPGAVSVRASTGNLDGATGAGRSIAARALVTIVPSGRAT
ncbi:MAG TPA: 2-C-methyl-D-erythritol 4-phosphate cytidylyltransferase [Candidatus Baltobacteraceae bacterium]|nr:2-C-methyl-D-erythritol 4-phosphate cytidylyltransferase [Candidatus Baltobacteraceae bacterium]